MCNRDVKGQVLKCKSVFEPHLVCIGCMEMHFSQNLGRKQIPCPVLGCTNGEAFVVKDDLYGKVSAFYYEQHCKEMFAPAQSPVEIELPAAVEPATTDFEELDITDLLS